MAISPRLASSLSANSSCRTAASRAARASAARQTRALPVSTGSAAFDSRSTASASLVRAAATSGAEPAPFALIRVARVSSSSAAL